MAKIKTYSIEAKADDLYGVAVKAGARTLHVDQPLFVGGADAGATPLEHLFAALAGCLATTFWPEGAPADRAFSASTSG